MGGAEAKAKGEGTNADTKEDKAIQSFLLRNHFGYFIHAGRRD